MRLPALEVILQRIDILIAVMFGICFIIDIVRAAKLGAAAIFLIAVFWADIWGLGLYSVLALNKVRINRYFQLFARLKAFGLALVAPSMELHSTQEAIKAYNEYKGDSFFKSPKETMKDLLQIVKYIHSDPTVVCWGPFESIMESVISKVDPDAVKDGTIQKYCGQLQGRTILILVTGVVVLIELMVYVRLWIRESAWAQSKIGSKNASTTQGLSDKDQEQDQFHDIEMGENSSRVRR